ncbi:hypothetical protein SFC55_00470 [Niallia taxi]
MLKDLRGPREMEPDVGMLFALVNENYQRLVSIVKGVPQGELEYKGLDRQ